MAISFALLTNGISDTDASSYTTASISPTAGRLVLVAVAVRISSGTPNVPTVTGASMTWFQIRTEVSGTRRLTIFVGVSVSPGSGVLTIDFAGQTQGTCGWSIAESPDVNFDPSFLVQQNGATDTGTDTGMTITLSSFGSTSNAAYGAIARASNAATTEGSGFSELSDQSSSEGLALQTQWKLNDNTVDWSWSSVDEAKMGVALEINAVAPPSTPIVIAELRGEPGAQECVAKFNELVRAHKLLDTEELTRPVAITDVIRYINGALREKGDVEAHVLDGWRGLVQELNALIRRHNG